jgi:hypothetical protein
MSDENKQALFLSGAEKGLAFIKEIEWERYKKQLS